MTKQTMGEFLGMLRKSHGYTQQEVAEKLNVSNRTLSSWETDRTTPDILLLPVIADLYGVTVDELIRGVRGDANEDEGNTRFSENALHAARKHRFGKFSTKSIILKGVGCLCSALFAVSFVLNLYLNTPLWLDLLLWILSACGVIVCGIILIYFKHNLMITEGIVLKEDYTTENKSFAFTVERNAINFLLICALPLLIEALVLLCIFIPKLRCGDYEYAYLFNLVNITYFEVNINYFDLMIKAYLIAILPALISGICLLATYIIMNCITVNKLATQNNMEIFKYNRKLLKKICTFGSIILIICALGIFFTYIWLYYDIIWEIISSVLVAIIALNFVVCSIVFMLKRKKTEYEFN